MGRKLFGPGSVGGGRFDHGHDQWAVNVNGKQILLDKTGDAATDAKIAQGLDKIDANGDGDFDRKELSTLAKDAKLTAGDGSYLLAAFDVRGNGALQQRLGAFVDAVHSEAWGKGGDVSVSNMFKTFIKDPDPGNTAAGMPVKDFARDTVKAIHAAGMSQTDTRDRVVELRDKIGQWAGVTDPGKLNALETALSSKDPAGGVQAWLAGNTSSTALQNIYVDPNALAAIQNTKVQ